MTADIVDLVDSVHSVRCQHSQSSQHGQPSQKNRPQAAWLLEKNRGLSPGFFQPAWISILNSQFSIQLVGSNSSNPSPYWPPLDTAEPRPRIRSCGQRSRRLRLGSVEARGRSGSCECHGLRDARLLALECSFDSSPNRCLTSVAITFPRAFEAHHSGWPPPVSKPRLWPACDPYYGVCCRHGSAPVLYLSGGAYWIRLELSCFCE